MVAGQVGETISVAVVPVVRGRNTDTDLAPILHQSTAGIPAQDLRLRHQHAINRHAQVLCFNLDGIYLNSGDTLNDHQV